MEKPKVSADASGMPILEFQRLTYFFVGKTSDGGFGFIFETKDGRKQMTARDEYTELLDADDGATLLTTPPYHC